MIHHSSRLQYEVRVDRPDPQFAKYLQQAIGGKDMLSFLIARDTMHQWDAVIEELGGIEAQLPIPNSTPQTHEATEHSYCFLNTSRDESTPQGRRSAGPSFDGRAELRVVGNVRHGMGQKPDPGRARKHSGAKVEQLG